MNNEIKEKLLSMSDKNYKEFTQKLLPGIDGIIGVRIPELRKIAKEIASEDAVSYFNNASDDSFEEIMLQGLVIGYANMELSETFDTINKFVPKIDNWSVCDTFCTGLKIANKYPNEMWEFILPFIRDTRTYYVRFAVVMMLKYFVNKEYINLAFYEFDNIKCNDYYSQMAIAWAISCYFLKFEKETIKYLKNNNLDDFTFNKSLQKITESYRVDKETKKLIKMMKRKY